jgi:ComF family protein
MKQFHEYPLTATVGHLLADRLAAQLSDDLPDLIVPIPKHWLRRVLRGTNTSEVLAETLSGRLRRPAALAALRQCRPTRKQSLLGRSERQQNVAGALQLAKAYDFDKAHVLIVDDIMTTGATANEAARVLARAGAQRITVAVVARADLGRECQG